jgi:hypothetical protein
VRKVEGFALAAASIGIVESTIQGRNQAAIDLAIEDNGQAESMIQGRNTPAIALTIMESPTYTGQLTVRKIEAYS